MAEATAHLSGGEQSFYVFFKKCRIYVFVFDDCPKLHFPDNIFLRATRRLMKECVMKKYELRRKMVKFLCIIGLELNVLPQKEQQFFKDRSTSCTKYCIRSSCSANIALL